MYVEFLWLSADSTVPHTKALEPVHLARRRWQCVPQQVFRTVHDIYASDPPRKGRRLRCFRYALLTARNCPLQATNPHNNDPKLLSTKDPLSIPITTVNFRRFVAKVGPIFWLQDRIEEIVMWRKGWKYTAVWMCAYTFLCEYVCLGSKNLTYDSQATTRDLLC